MLSFGVVFINCSHMSLLVMCILFLSLSFFFFIFFFCIFFIHTSVFAFRHILPYSEYNISSIYISGLNLIYVNLLNCISYNNIQLYCNCYISSLITIPQICNFKIFHVFKSLFSRFSYASEIHELSS